MKFVKVWNHQPGFYPTEIWQEDEFSNEYILWTNDGCSDSPSYKDYLFTTKYKSLDELEAWE